MVPRRIAWLVYGSLDQVSGGYIYDRLVVEQLRELGDEVTVLSLEPGRMPALPSARDFDCLVGDELCFRELLSIFRDAEPELVRVLLIHHLSAWELAPGAERDATLALERSVVELADARLATSFVTAERLQREGLASSVHVAEPGADRLARPAERAERGGAPVRFLFIGNLIPRKQVLELVQAFARLPDERAELVLVGAELDAAYAAELRRAAQAPHLQGRVHWRGGLDPAGVAAELERADALVLPSRLEGYGMVLSEALWSGVPVIAARVGAAVQLSEATGAGLLHDGEDSEGLFENMNHFMGKAALRARLREAAWQAHAVLPRWRATALNLRAALPRSR
jgi:glycosyltransferase involved in cell wall biosynthesis